MTRQELEKLFALLRATYTRSAALRDRRVMAAWELVLAPYDYAAVRDRAVALARVRNYPPDVGELTAALPLPHGAQAPAAAPRAKSAGKAWMRRCACRGETPSEEGAT